MAESGAKQPLDEVMLAMDVVDTLRHRRLLVEQELASDERDQRMLERLRQIYTSQGMEVPDHVLREGVEALREDRFVYHPPEPGLAARLAHIYVDRGKWGRRLAFTGGVLVILGIVYFVAVVWPSQREAAALKSLAQEAEAVRSRLEGTVEDAEIIQGAERIYNRLQSALEGGDSEQVVAATATLASFAELPDALAAAREGALAAAAVPEAASLARKAHGEGIAALKAGDVTRAEAALDRLEDLRTRLDQAYQLRIVSRPGEPSGVWRVPAANPDSRNYYIIVEAIGAEGAPVKVPVTSEEDGSTTTTSQWGLRVDERTFNRIRGDKEDDGIIQDEVFGAKERGHLSADYRYPTTGGAITSW